MNLEESSPNTNIQNGSNCANCTGSQTCTENWSAKNELCRGVLLVGQVSSCGLRHARFEDTQSSAKFGTRFVILVHEIPNPLIFLFAGSGHHFNPIYFVCLLRATACDRKAQEALIHRLVLTFGVWRKWPKECQLNMWPMLPPNKSSLEMLANRGIFWEALEVGFLWSQDCFCVALFFFSSEGELFGDILITTSWNLSWGLLKVQRKRVSTGFTRVFTVYIRFSKVY